ncbi:MAG TPA: HAMP domain-containing sensor histidine kinase [bacterium]|nr:HAMP domain-containing sensor histidine kinase [bacterium]
MPKSVFHPFRRLGAAAKTLWQRDQDPFLDELRWRLDLRLLLLTAGAGLGLGWLRWYTLDRLDLIPLVSLGALAAWLWLRSHAKGHRTVVRILTLLFLAIALSDLARPGQSAPWALFCIVALPAYGTLVDGLTAGGLAMLCTVGAAVWAAIQFEPGEIRLLAVFAGLTSLCFYATSLTYTWIFGALVERRRMTQAAIATASASAGQLARTLGDEVTVANAQLRAGLGQGLLQPDQTLALQEILARSRAALPQEPLQAGADPERLLEDQRQAAHRTFLLVATTVAAGASAAILVLHRHLWWLPAVVAVLSGLLYGWGQRPSLRWIWRVRLFLALCLSAMVADSSLSNGESPAASLIFLPLIVFYSGLLDSIPSVLATSLAGLVLLWAQSLQNGPPDWPSYPTWLVIQGLLIALVLGFSWAIRPLYRSLLAELAAQEEDWRRSLLSYRRLVSVLYHDLANPLAVLKTLAALPPELRRPDDLDRSRRMLERLEAVTAAARLAVEPAAGALKATVESWVAGAEDLFRERLKAKELAWHVALEAGLPALGGAAQARDQVLGHLVSNAIRFSPQGGAIALRAERYGPWLRVTVRDLGDGFPTDVLEDLQQGAAPRPRPDLNGETGNGFGLLLALATARGMGGRLELRNQGQGGAEAMLWLPGD